MGGEGGGSLWGGGQNYPVHENSCLRSIQVELLTTSRSCFSAASLLEITYAEAPSNFIETTFETAWVFS